MILIRVGGRRIGETRADVQSAGQGRTRARGGLDLDVHLHTLVLDGVFAESPNDSLAFHPADSARATRTLPGCWPRSALVCGGSSSAAGLDGEEAGDTPDPLAEESAALAGISSASVQRRVALGSRAGARVLQVGREPDAPWVTSRGPRQAHLEGFDLHANLAVRADDREGLERLCRYILRPRSRRIALRASATAACWSRSRANGPTVRRTCSSSPSSSSRSSPC